MGIELDMKLLLLCRRSYKMSGLIACVLIVLSGCARKGNKRQLQAQNYYKLCMVELSETDCSDTALRKALDYGQKAVLCQAKPEYQAICATILFKLGQYDKSLAYFKQALAQTKNSGLHGEILNNKACVYAQLGDRDKAEKVWKKLVRAPYYLTPEVALVNLAKLCVHDQEYEEAKEYCKQAITAAPTYIDAHFYLAILSYKTNDISLAKKEVLTTLFMEPNHHGALQLEKILQQM